MVVGIGKCYAVAGRAWYKVSAPYLAMAYGRDGQVGHKTLSALGPCDKPGHSILKSFLPGWPSAGGCRYSKIPLQIGQVRASGRRDQAKEEVPIHRADKKTYSFIPCRFLAALLYSLHRTCWHNHIYHNNIACVTDSHDLDWCDSSFEGSKPALQAMYIDF